MRIFITGRSYDAIAPSVYRKFLQVLKANKPDLFVQTPLCYGASPKIGQVVGVLLFEGGTAKKFLFSVASQTLTSAKKFGMPCFADGARWRYNFMQSVEKIKKIIDLK